MRFSLSNQRSPTSSVTNAEMQPIYRGLSMKNTNLAKLAAGSLALGTVLIGAGPMLHDMSSAFADTGSRETANAKQAAKNAAKALAKGKAQKAVTFAERAAGLSPSDSSYRMLLGDAYLAAGRFSSAEASFADVLALTPANDRAALKLALTRVALGKPEDARALLTQNKAALPAADYGLAVALTGDLDTAISTLEAIIRSPASDARARQNLALAYALAGRWPQARVLASQDLSPDLVDGRMTQWAALAHPKAASDQVASILGVKPAYDPGQPVALAMNHPNDVVQTAAANVSPQSEAPVVAAAEPVAPAALFEVGNTAPAPAPVRQAPATRGTHFAEIQEVVQPIRQESRQAPLIKSSHSPIKTAAKSSSPRVAVAQKATPKGRTMIVELAHANKPAAKPAHAALASAKPAKASVAVKAPVKAVQVAAAKPQPKPVAKPVQTIVSAKTGKKVEAGQFVVQLGAYGSKSAAASAWASASSKVGGLGGHNAVTSQVDAGGKTVQRLALSGFGSAADAQKLCAKIKSSGGQCFVKGAASEGARWASLKPGKPTQLASR